MRDGGWSYLDVAFASSSFHILFHVLPAPSPTSASLLPILPTTFHSNRLRRLHHIGSYTSEMMQSMDPEEEVTCSPTRAKYFAAFFLAQPRAHLVLEKRRACDPR